MIRFQPILPTDIVFLNHKDVLYTSDFRACGESLEYNIPAMWRYENLLDWICKDVSITVNNDFQSQDGVDKNNYILVPKGATARQSIFERLSENQLYSYNKIWTAIPNPDADNLGARIGATIQYSYKDFLYRNNKIAQKQLFGSATPRWTTLPEKNLMEVANAFTNEGYVKRSHGSGGFTVFPMDHVSKDGITGDTLLQNLGVGDKWFVEDKVFGIPSSIQCLIDEDSADVIVFGASEQIIEGGTLYSGANLYCLYDLSNTVKEQLVQIIENLAPILKGYTGFFGIDFFLSDNRVIVLEANIRMTAATVPTLVFNQRNGKTASYREDADMNSITDSTIVLARDSGGTVADLLEIKS